MGLFSFVGYLLNTGHNDTQQERPAPDKSLPSVSHTVPHTTDLMYPASLPRFDEIADGGHSDKRAIVYTVLLLDLNRNRPFSDKKLNAQDFGDRGKAYQILLEKGLIREPTQDKVLASLYTQDELKGFLRERGFLDLFLCKFVPASHLFITLLHFTIPFL